MCWGGGGDNTELGVEKMVVGGDNTEKDEKMKVGLMM